MVYIQLKFIDFFHCMYDGYNPIIHVLFVDRIAIPKHNKRSRPKPAGHFV